MNNDNDHVGNWTMCVARQHMTPLESFTTCCGVADIESRTRITISQEYQAYYRNAVQVRDVVIYCVSKIYKKLITVSEI